MRTLVVSSLPPAALRHRRLCPRPGGRAPGGGRGGRGALAAGRGRGCAGPVPRRGGVPEGGPHRRPLRPNRGALPAGPLLPAAGAAPSKVVTSLCLLWLVLRRPRVNLVVHEADRPVRWRPDYADPRPGVPGSGDRLVPHPRRADRPGARLPGPGARRADPAPGSPGGAGGPGRGPGALGIRGRRAGVRVRRVPPAFEGHRAGGGRVRRPAGRGPAVRGGVGPGPIARGLTPLQRPAGALRSGPRASRSSSVGSDDEEFDRWIGAADAVVLPYRRAWSSGVLARAHALGTPAIVSAERRAWPSRRDRDVVVESDAGTWRRRWPGASAGTGRRHRRPRGRSATAREHAHDWDPDDAPAERSSGKESSCSSADHLISVVLAALAQLTLKHGMNQVTDDGPAARPGAAGGHPARSPRTCAVWIGLAIFALSASSGSSCCRGRRCRSRTRSPR